MTVRDLRYANTTPSLTSERWAVSLRGVLALYALVPWGYCCNTTIWYFVAKH